MNSKELFKNISICHAGDFFVSHENKSVGLSIDYNQYGNLFKENRGIYFLCAATQLKYIGICRKTSRTLEDRLKDYLKNSGKISGAYGRALKIRDLINRDQKVSIWFFIPEIEMNYGSLKIDLVNGLEQPLIRSLKPDWNKE